MKDAQEIKDYHEFWETGFDNNQTSSHNYIYGAIWDYRIPYSKWTQSLDLEFDTQIYYPGKQFFMDFYENYDKIRREVGGGWDEGRKARKLNSLKKSTNHITVLCKPGTTNNNLTEEACALDIMQACHNLAPQWVLDDPNDPQFYVSFNGVVKLDLNGFSCRKNSAASTMGSR